MAKVNYIGYGESPRGPEIDPDGAKDTIYKRWSVVERALFFFLVNPEVKEEQQRRVEKTAKEVLEPVSKISDSATAEGRIAYNRHQSGKLVVNEQPAEPAKNSAENGETENEYGYVNEGLVPESIAQEKISQIAEKQGVHIPGETVISVEESREELGNVFDKEEQDKKDGLTNA